MNAFSRRASRSRPDLRALMTCCRVSPKSLVPLRRAVRVEVELVADDALNHRRGVFADERREEFVVGPAALFE